MKELLKNLVLRVLLVILISFLVSAVYAVNSTAAKITIAYSAEHTIAAKITVAYSTEHTIAAEFTHNNDILYYKASLLNVYTDPWRRHIDQNVESIAISSDGSRVAVGCDEGLIYLFDYKGNVTWNRQFGNITIQSISFSKDGNYIDASNALNQTFYINLDGDLVDLPTTPAVTVIPSATISPSPMIPTQTDFLSTITGSIRFLQEFFSWPQ